MALKLCRECGTSVSTDARTCPKCGKEWPTGRPLSGGFWFALVLVAFVFIVMNLAGCSGSDATEPRPAGRYVLASIDGRDVPATLSSTATSSNVVDAATLDFTT